MKRAHPDLQSERDRATFKVEELTNIIDGGPEITAQRRRFEQLITEDPRFQDDIPSHSIPVHDIYEKSMQRTNLYIKKLEECKDELGIEPVSYETSALLQNPIVFPHGSPVALHIAGFAYTILSQADTEQLTRWGPLMMDFDIIGAYAQTELGHGSNIRELETTATYDPATEEFVLNSPTATSIKFWPGGLAKTGNYAVVLAQLYTKGRCEGIHTFIVQLRSLEDHKPMPGVTVGDIGPKWAMHGFDNGFLRLNNVRIPRDYMLMKHAQVLPDGTYVKPNNPYGTYGTMLMIRLNMVHASHATLGRAVTIAIRYAAIRRQGRILPNEPEVKLLDYKTHQYRLVHNIAQSYAFLFVFKYMTESYMQHTLEPKAETLAELHAVSSGMKALGTQAATFGIEQCRSACGGVGYLQASNLPTLYAQQSAAMTYEGENYVLLQQTARFLMKTANMSKGGQPLSPSVEFLNSHNLVSASASPLDEIITMFQKTTKSMIMKVAEKMRKDIHFGKLPEIAWNDNVVELIKSVQVFMQTFTLVAVSSMMKTIPMSAPLHEVLMTLFEFLATYWVYENTGDFSLHGQIPAHSIRKVTERIHVLLEKLRCNLVALTDAFDFHDKSLNSILGNHDGNVYEHIIQYLKQIPENKVQVHPAYEKYISPLLKSHL